MGVHMGLAWALSFLCSGSGSKEATRARGNPWLRCGELPSVARLYEAASLAASG